MSELTQKTKDKIEELKKLLDKNYNILLTGGSGVGKTCLAKKLAEEITGDKENFQLVSFHPSFAYEDFVKGIVANTVNEKIQFETEEKILLKAIEKAKSLKESNKKYVLILDDINRSNVASVFGELLTMLESHNNESTNSTTLASGGNISIPDNLYIIATMNTSIRTPFSVDYAFLRRFAVVNIESDFGYVGEVESKDDKESGKNKNGDIDLSRAGLYRYVKEIVINNQPNENEAEKNKYIIGHGYFSDESNYWEKVEYQVIPMLEQYLKDGVLDKGAKVEIDKLKNEFNNFWTTDYDDFESRDISIK